MRNYQYITASLPDIALDYRSGGFDYPSLEGQVKELCSKEDVRLIDWLSAGNNPDILSDYFYNAIEKTGSRFLREYFRFDRKLREAKVAFLEGKPYAPEFEAAFKESNLIEREKKIDALLWKKADETVTFDVFTFDMILSFLAKARIVERWSHLDQTAGEEFFKNLVQEVRGTFKGIKEQL